MMDIIYRPEQPGDVTAIHHVNEAAFGQPNEADLVDALRANGQLLISLVAENEGEVVAHIAFSPVTVEGGGATWGAVGLAPVAVLPEWQGRGVGSELIRRGLEACRQQGHEVVFVLGHPDYYPRFGFASAEALGVGCTYDVPPEAFMAAELRPGAIAGRIGTVRFAAEFDGV